MKTFSDWRSLLLLKKWDNYLLTHYPVVWRTKAVFVLFYGIIGAILLFAAGYFYPLDAQHLSVDPIEPIDISTDSYYLFALLWISVGLFYWAYRQYQLGFPFTKIKHTLLTLALYGACFWVVLGFTVPAYRMGTIVHTADWMNQEDLDTLENSGIYPYGFVFLKSDTLDNIVPTDTLFQRREIVLKSIVEIEDTLLENLYNTDSTFWKIWLFDHYRINDLTRLYRSDLPDLSYLSYLSYTSNLPNPAYASNPSDLSHTSNPSYLSYLSYRSYTSDLSYMSYQSYMSYRSYTSEFLLYNQYKNTPRLSVKFGKYKFLDTIDEWAKIPKDDNAKDSIIITRPALPYSVENAVRSVKHASLYIQVGMFWKYLFYLIHYIPFLAILLFSSAFLSFKNVSISMTIVILGFILILNYGLGDSGELLYNEGSYLILPISGLLMLCLSLFKKRYYQFELFAVNLVVTSISLSICIIFFNELFHKNEVASYPSNTSFFGMQIIGLLSLFLFTHVRTLPKAR